MRPEFQPCPTAPTWPIIVTVLMVFLAGMTVGGLLVGSANKPTRVAMNDTVPVDPDGLPLTVRQ